MTPLAHAARNGRFRIFLELPEAEGTTSELSSQNAPTGETFTHYAVKGGSEMIFREVLSRGAPRDIPNKEGDLLIIHDTARSGLRPYDRGHL